MSIAVLTPIFSFAAFILLLLVTLSVPIIKSIQLFVLEASVNLDVFAGFGGSVEGLVNFGVFGYCIPAISIEYATISKFYHGLTNPHIEWLDSTKVHPSNASKPVWDSP